MQLGNDVRSVSLNEKKKRKKQKFNIDGNDELQLTVLNCALGRQPLCLRWLSYSHAGMPIGEDLE